MPAYAFPELTEGASSALRARRQGKSCFNFAKVDEALIGELADITGRSIEHYIAAIAAGAGPFGDAARFEPARVALARSAG